MAKKYNEDEVFKKIDSSMLKRSFAYLKPYPLNFTLIFFFGIFSTVFFLFFTRDLGQALDILMDTRSISFLPSTCLWLFIYLVLGVMFQYIRGRLLIQVKNKISIQFRNDLFLKLSRIPQKYYDDTPHGKIYTRVTQYVDHITYVICEVLLDFLLQIITFLIVFWFMLTISFGLTLLTFLIVLSFLLFYLYITPRWLCAQTYFQSKESNRNAYLSETLKGVKTTQAFHQEEKNVSIFQDLLKSSRNAIKGICYFGNMSWSFSHIFETITSVFIYVFGFIFYYPSLSMGTLIVFVSYSSHFWYPITTITRLYGSVVEAIQDLERTYDLLDYPEEENGVTEVSFPSGTVEMKEVRFSYVSNKPVLEHFNMVIPAGSKVAIVGHTGSGKSTIAQLLNRLYDYQKGQILVDGVEIKNLTLDSLRSQVMMMNQDGFLFSKTIYENLTFGNKKISLKKVRDICKKIQIDEFIMSLPNKYDTEILNNGSNFSTGQKQMLCIARMLLQNPKVAILDEATSNVDVITEKAIVNTFFQCFDQKTTIVIAHRLATIIHSDIIFVMDHGKLVEVGNHEQLLSKKGKYYQLYQAQSII